MKDYRNYPDAVAARERLKGTFKKLSFVEEGHRYYINGELFEGKSTTKDIERFYDPFDDIAKAQEMEERGDGLAVDLLAAWRAKALKAQLKGTRVHDFAENFVVGESKPSCLQEWGVLQWYNSLPDYWVHIVSELKVCTIDESLVGMVDDVFYNLRNGSLILGDFKTNEVDLFKWYGGRMYHPFVNQLNNTFGHYVAQLNVYAMMLEQHGFDVEDMFIIWLIPYQDKIYRKIDIPNYVEMLTEEYDY